MVSQRYLKHVETTNQALESLHWCREWDTKKNQKANPCKTLPRTLNMDCEKPKVAKYIEILRHWEKNGFPRHHPSYPSWDQQPSYFQPKAPRISQGQVEGRLRQIPAPCDPQFLYHPWTIGPSLQHFPFDPEHRQCLEERLSLPTPYLAGSSC